MSPIHFPQTAKKALICATFISAAVCCGLAPQAFSQEPGPAPIRVESDDVLVPVWVFDTQRYSKLFRANQAALFTDLFAGDFAPWEDVYVGNLTATDFRLFEDGSEQKIRSLIVHAPHIVRVSDNFGEHYEFVGSGSGRWTFPDRPTPYQALNFDVLMHWPSYVIAYDPPPSRDGNCHQVAVSVDRPDSLVYAQQRYCRNTLDPTDPLAGTSLHRRMEADLARSERGKIPVSLAVFPSFSTAATNRVDIVLEFPWQALKYTFADRVLYETVGVLGSITSSDGTEVTRFSDVEGHNYRDDVTTDILMGSGPIGDPTAILNIPRRYDKQVYLAPGRYDLRIVLTDGKNFGRAEAAFTVDAVSPKGLTISAIALARRFRSSKLSHIDLAPFEGEQTPLISQDIDSTVTADKRFMKNSTLHCYFEIYEPKQSGSPPRKAVDVSLRILNAKSGTVARQLGSIAPAEYALPGNPIISIARAIDIGGLPKGRYQLEVQATDSAGNATPWRTTDFTIE